MNNLKFKFLLVFTVILTIISTLLIYYYSYFINDNDDNDNDNDDNNGFNDIIDDNDDYNLINNSTFDNAILKGGIAQYSPQYKVDWGIPNDLPASCSIDVVNILERHGARFPAHKPRVEMAKSLNKLQTSKKQPSKKSPFNFIKNYDIDAILGEEDLVTYGRNQVYKSGRLFKNQYQSLLHNSLPPFYRSPSSPRVIESAQLFKLGLNGQSINETYDDLDLIIPEGKRYNNTLDISSCPLASNHSTTIGDDVSDVFASLWTPTLIKRFKSVFGKVDITHDDIVNYFHFCAFDTMAQNGVISDWCRLFELNDFYHYSYYLILQKYYDSSYGHPLGAARGIGYVNELIARLNSSDVIDSTSTNSTLDHDRNTFPLPPKDRKELGHRIFVDFSHDTSMINILTALGLAKPPGNRHLPFLISRKEVPPTYLFDISKYVPFAGKIVFEKVHCDNSIYDNEADENYIRIKINEGVYPLKFNDCGQSGQSLGLCQLDNFFATQNWSIQGGNWDECYE